MHNFLKKQGETLNFYLLILLLLSMFLGRAALSISMIVYVLYALMYFWSIGARNMTKPQKNYVFLYLFMIALGLLSYFVSENKVSYFIYMRVWLPFAFLPAAFFVVPSLSGRRMYILIGVFIFTVFLGAIWSLSFLFEDPQHIIESYQHAKVLPTPFYGDHIRFSLMVVLASSLSVMLAMVADKYPILYRWEKEFFVFLAISLFIYLHILAVKSGLLAGWLSFSWLALFYLLKKRYKLFFILASIVVITPVLSLMFVPTFQQKLNYIKYEFQENRETGRVEHLSDVNRLVSYRLAWQSILEHPVTGVGLGDIEDETQSKYHQYFPEVDHSSIILPHNQWLCSGVALGFLGFINLTMIFLFPLTVRRYRRGFMGIVLSIVSLVALMVEPVFMIQYGVATYLFMSSILFKYYSARDNKSTRLVFACENLEQY